MSKVTDLVHAFIHGPDEADEEVGQTIYLNRRARARLLAMAQVSGRSKSRTASLLLAAALEEAISALPDEPIMIGNFTLVPTSGPQPYTPTEFVETTLADWQYHAKNEALGLVSDPQPTE
jgi:hypothetical protein